MGVTFILQAMVQLAHIFFFSLSLPLFDKIFKRDKDNCIDKSLFKIWYNLFKLFFRLGVSLFTHWTPFTKQEQKIFLFNSEHVYTLLHWQVSLMELIIFLPNQIILTLYSLNSVSLLFMIYNLRYRALLSTDS